MELSYFCVTKMSLMLLYEREYLKSYLPYSKNIQADIRAPKVNSAPKVTLKIQGTHSEAFIN